MKILNLFGNKFSVEASELLNNIGDVDYLELKVDQLKLVIHKYDIIVCSLSINFNKDLLVKAKKLKYLCTPTTGLDHVDLIFCKKKGISVLSLKNETNFLNKITGTSELALGLLISLVRHIPEAKESVLKGVWDRKKFYGHSLNGKTIGIIGMGRLGKKMAKYCYAIGLSVLFYDPYVSNLNKNFKKVSLVRLLSASDFISIHVHLDNTTELMISKALISKAKKGVYIINTSRGKIVDERGLIELLKSRHVAGYATDVLDGELMFIGHDCSQHPLVKFAKNNDNVIILPHIGGMTYESRRDTDLFIVKKLMKYI